MWLGVTNRGYTPVFTPPVTGGPLVLYTDITDGPITGGENNKGTYISVFFMVPGGYSGTFGDWGTNSHLTIGGVEVDNYRCLEKAVGNGTYGSGNAGEGVGEFWGIYRICAQIGAIGNPTIGSALPVTININGKSPINSSNAGFLLDLDGNQISFTPVNGLIYFFSLTGTDQTSGTAPSGTQGTIGNPLRHLQTYNGTNFGGAVWGIGGGTVTTTNCIPPGSHVIGRGGDYSNDTSFNGVSSSANGSWCDLFRRTGNPPSAASSSGSIVINSYPGPAGANTPERVIFKTLSGNAGGFNMCNTNDSNLPTPWGELGYCHYITIANLLVWGPSGAYNGNGAAASSVNLQTHAVGFRCVNLDMAIPLTSGSPLTGAIGGYGTNGRRLGNFVHDVFDPSGGLQCHGFYIGENTGSNNPAGVGELHGINAYNYMIRTTGGQGIMLRGAYQTESAPFEVTHHNIVIGAGKFCYEAFDQRDRAIFYCNIAVAQAFTAPGTTGTQAGFFFNSDNVTATNGIYVGYNTLVGKLNHYSYIANQGASNTGSILIEGNIIRQDATAGNSNTGLFGNWLIGNGTALTMTLNGNCWFDATGTSLNPSDANGIFVDPLLTNITTPPYDFHPSSSSTVPNKGVTPPSITMQALDMFFQVRPQGANIKWSLGAVERVGG